MRHGYEVGAANTTIPRQKSKVAFILYISANVAVTRANSVEVFRPSTLYIVYCPFDEKLPKKFDLHQPAFRSLAVIGKSYDSAICFA